MHWRIERALSAGHKAAVRTLARQTLPVRSKTGIVSFTFDDIPRSAVTVGSKILERHNAYGTFYLSGKLAGGDSDAGPNFIRDDAAELAGRGHEIGCHTFGHQRVPDIDVDAVRDQCTRNQRWVSEILPDYTLRSFAYPQGAVSVAAKRLLGARFATCRWNEPGLNAGKVDVSLLRANKIYSRLDNMATLEALIDENRLRGGWLIFYSHDVSNEPSRFGCTPSDLERIVAHAASSGSKVLSVRNALGALAYAS